jgi:maltokinase
VIDPAVVRDQLPSKRWFGSKGRDIVGVDIVDETIFENGPPALVGALVNVNVAGGERELYHVILLVDHDGTTRDAFDQPERLAAFGELMARGESIKGSLGVFNFGGPGLDPMSPPGSQSARAIGAEQSNTSFVLDEAVIVKMFRRLHPGANPELELNRLLTAEGFDSIPAHVGEVTYEGELDGEDVFIDLGIAQNFIADGTEGWEDVLEHLRSVYSSVSGDEIDPAVAVEELAGDMLARIEELGDVTASLHVLLGREELDPQIAPEPIDASDLSAWSDSALLSLNRLLDADSPDELIELGLDIRERIEQLRSIDDAGWKTRVHGDYHLGQVLGTARGWLILDFEGEPARPLEARSAKRSPLVDVAGMLRSFSYAPLAVLFERTEPGSEEWERLSPFAAAWEDLARARFLSGYLSRSHEGHMLPADRDVQATMLDVFEIDKVLYEVAYEMDHRPDWLPLPLAGIRRVLARGGIG